MRFITKNPKEVVPDICEKDLQRNLILVFMHSRFSNNDLLAYIIEYPDALNWIGIKIPEDMSFSPWGCARNTPIHLIEYIKYCWDHWHRSDPVFYICESLQDIDKVCEYYMITDINVINTLKDRLIKMKG